MVKEKALKIQSSKLNLENKKAADKAVSQKRNRWTNKLGPSVNIAQRLAEAKNELDQINKMDQAKSKTAKVIQMHVKNENVLAA
ncbi:MAG: hypothetical protein LBK26_02765 [Rickettsiales bacterium]|jgi:hypothetical protein|nr:hypothetical protein [Rickettsiales bacterium]